MSSNNNWHHSLYHICHVSGHILHLVENKWGKKNIIKQLLYSHHVLGAHYSMAQAMVKLRNSSGWGYRQTGWGVFRLTVQIYCTLLTAGERYSSNKHFAPTDYVYLNSSSHYGLVFLFKCLVGFCLLPLPLGKHLSSAKCFCKVFLQNSRKIKWWR